MTPIPHHPTFDIIDSTKMSSFKSCARKYFYDYILGWSTTDSNALIHGSAMHVGQEYLWLKGLSRDNAMTAAELYTDYYAERVPKDQWQDNRPRCPYTAEAAFLGYLTEYEQLERDKWEVLFTEVVGSVPIGTDHTGKERRLTFRIDVIARNKQTGKIVVIDHKTTSRNSRQWREQFFLSFQLYTYLHAMHCLFEQEEVYGCMINGIINATKDGLPQFERIVFRKSSDMMREWLWTANYWYSQIEWNMARQAELTDEDPVMTAWPKNTESCTKYYGCPFLPYCGVWANPITRIDTKPAEFVHKRWDPHTIDDRPAKFVLDSTAKEITPVKELAHAN